MLLNVLPVRITADNGNTVTTYAFLDNGCTDTLVDSELAEHLGMRGKVEQLSISTITKKDNVVDSRQVSFSLSPVDGFGEDIDVSQAYVLPDLKQSQRVLPELIDVSRYPHLHDVQFPQVEIKRVSILVGSNVPYAHIQQEVRVPENSKGLFGCRYPLGWTVCGPCDLKSCAVASVNFVSVGHKSEDLVERFWELEGYGAEASNVDEGPMSIEDMKAMKIINDTTRLTPDGHYEVGLLWKDDEPSLPNNRQMAERRAELLRRRLTKPGNEDLAAKYREVMQGYIDKGFARKLTEKELEKESDQLVPTNAPSCESKQARKVTCSIRCCGRV